MNSERYRVLLVDDESGWCVRPIAKLEDNGFKIMYEEKAENALRKIKSFKPHAVLLDILFGNENKGKPTFKKIKEKYPDLPVIMLTSTMRDTFNSKDYPSCAFGFAKDQLNSGSDEAYREFAEKIKRAIEKSRTTFESLSEEFGFIVGSTETMMKICEDILEVALADSPVMITGESGTGKEMIAKAIHNKSFRQSKQFMAVNCTAIPKELLESDLFGHEKGSFAGAYTLKKGLFEVADGGTLLLDEIAELKLELQGKLLRAIQEGIIRRVGGTRDIKVDVRLISATNRDIESDVKEGRFREDLYYRLNVVRLHTPPLRERKEDIPNLLEYFIKKFNREMGKDVLIETEEGKRDYLRQDVLDLLKNYDWPGNIREFENKVERAILKAGDCNVLLFDHFDINAAKNETAVYDIDRIVEEVFKGKWKGEDNWKTFLKRYPKQGGVLKDIMLKCIERLKKEQKKNLQHRDTAELFGINEGNMRKCIKKDLKIEWKTVKQYK